MSIARAYHSFPRRSHRFSGVLESWFPMIHHKTFTDMPRAAIQSAVRRTTDRA